MKPKFLVTIPLLAALLAALLWVIGCGPSFGYNNRVVRVEENELTVADKQGINQETYQVALDAQVSIDGQPAQLDDLRSGDAIDITVQQREGQEVVTKIDAKSMEATEPGQPSPEPTDQPSDVTPLEPQGDVPALPPGAAPDQQERQVAEPMPEQGLQEPATQPDQGPQAPAAEEPSSAEGSDPQAAEEAAEEPIEQAVDGSFHGTIASLSKTESQLVIKDQQGQEHTIMVNEQTQFTLDGEEAKFSDLKVDQHVEVTAEGTGPGLVAQKVDATSA